MKKQLTISDFIPKTTTKQLCDCERFIEGIKLLVKECNVVSYSGLDIHFADGSSGGYKGILNAATGWR